VREGGHLSIRLSCQNLRQVIAEVRQPH
jgi:hypothetical protein